MNIFFVADCGCMSRDECDLTNWGGECCAWIMCLLKGFCVVRH